MPGKRFITYKGIRLTLKSVHRTKSAANRKADWWRDFGMYAQIRKSGGGWGVFASHYTRVYYAARFGGKTKRGGRKLFWYVTMTDKFFSYTAWSGKNRANKFVVKCETHTQALAVARNARRRPEMIHVNIRRTKPSYDKRRYKTSWRTYKQLGRIWKRR